MGESIGGSHAAPRLESLGTRWARRLVSVSSLTMAFALLLAAAPVLLPLAALVDALRGSRWARVRFLGVGFVFLGCELLGLIASAALWLTLGFGASRARFNERNFVVQRWWVRSIFETSRRILGVQVHVEGVEAVSQGPVLLLIRHASLVDTLLPARLISGRFGLHLRYVLKRDLLWDPCLDVVGQRLPNAFVRRGGADTAGDVAAIRAIASDLGPREGVALFPEGTRYSPKLRTQLLRKLEDKGDREGLARAQALQHVLPPRAGGVLALLDAAPGVDVGLCAHRGFGDVRSFADIMNGALVGRDVFVEFWRCPAATIPSDKQARLQWLHTQWCRVDAMVGGDALHDPE